MSFLFKVRDFFMPRRDTLKEVGLREGNAVLDYGCGPGSHILPIEDLIGQSGKIYALDIHPFAVERVKNLAAGEGLTNVEAILSDCRTGLPDDSIDAVLLYDILHDLSEPNTVLTELHRVLKTDGTLSVADHHWKGQRIVAAVTDGGLFRLAVTGKKTHGFVKAER
ncbi:MAG TPA: class I SAM-dependent methyltransferase [Dehalococcoidia bacterium]|nr:class I SAM-dependent methyltransferase [Dehalococcoidia bacterium]